MFENPFLDRGVELGFEKEIEVLDPSALMSQVSEFDRSVDLNGIASCRHRMSCESLHVQQLHSLAIGIIDMYPGRFDRNWKRNLEANSLRHHALSSQLAEVLIGFMSHVMVVGRFGLS